MCLVWALARGVHVCLSPVKRYINLSIWASPLPARKHCTDTLVTSLENGVVDSFPPGRDVVPPAPPPPPPTPTPAPAQPQPPATPPTFVPFSLLHFIQPPPWRAPRAGYLECNLVIGPSRTLEDSTHIIFPRRLGNQEVRPETPPVTSVASHCHCMSIVERQFSEGFCEVHDPQGF